MVTVLAFTHFFWRADYPWQLALLAGLSIGALVYVLRRTVDQMIGLLSPWDSEEGSAGSGEASTVDGDFRQGKSNKAANNNRWTQPPQT